MTNANSVNAKLELTAADGHRLSAYLATPTGTPRGALVVVQEIFGVNPHIRAVADAYAADGYLCIAPALFDRVERGLELGYTPEDTQRGRALKAACADVGALLDIRAALAQVKGAGRAGIVGYCWGGYLAWLASGAVDGLSASVVYYGGGVPARGDVQPLGPVLAHFGEQDTHIPLEGVAALQASHPALEVHLYPAGHGFNCDQRGSFDAPSAALARQRSLAFLRQHLG
jgi:carboxymethylenebutenolidase